MEDKEIILETKVPKPKKQKLFLAVVLTAVISVLLSSALFYFAFLSFNKNSKLLELDSLVNKYFYGQVNNSDLLDSIMSGYMDGIGDKYAAYYSANEAAYRSNTLAGLGQGIGMTVVLHPDTKNIYVVNVYNDGPAAKAGILAGDQICAIDSVSVTEIGYNQALTNIVREIGETVDLTLLRKDKTFNLTVEYSEFVAQSVFGKMLSSDIGYIEITSFNDATVPQFKNTVDDLLEKGAKALIFDLRSNGGGTVNSVTQMLDYLCPEGVIMTVKYKDKSEETIARSDKNEINVPMAVLTNSATASASELFTANIKDFGKGISVGEKTFGKGVMQTTYTLKDGSQAVFTVAEFFPHSKISFNEKGIEPDIKVTPTEEELLYRYITPTEQDPVVKAAVDFLGNQQ